MSVLSLDHVNIQTGDVHATAKFYAEILGLRPGNTPMSLPPEQAQWLFDEEGRPIIHLLRSEDGQGPTGPIHHIALRCKGKAALIERLKARDAKYELFEGMPGLTLIFTRDPHGILLELNFLGE